MCKLCPCNQEQIVSCPGMQGWFNTWMLVNVTHHINIYLSISFLIEHYEGLVMAFGSMLLKVLNCVWICNEVFLKNKKTFNILLETSWSFHLSRDLGTELYLIPLNHHSHSRSRAPHPQVSLVPARGITAPSFTERLLRTKHRLDSSRTLFQLCSYNHLREQQHPYLTDKETMAQNDKVNCLWFCSQLAAEPSSANFQVDYPMAILSASTADVVLHILQAN